MPGNGCWGIEIKIDGRLTSMGVFLAMACITVNWEGVQENYTDKWGILVREAVEELSSKYTLEMLRENRIARSYRDFFWRHGIDPTKTRPAGEALARRLIRKGELRTINPIVDAGNLASTLTLVSVGLYDIDKLPSRNLELTYSRGGEVFKPIGGKPMTLKRGVPVLKSGELVMHIYPYRDSVETMITSDTNRVLALAAGVKGISEEICLDTLMKVALYMERMGLCPGWKLEPTIIRCERKKEGLKLDGTHDF